MPRHLLLDLDGTLLGVRMEEFIPAMVRGMTEHAALEVPPALFAPALQAGFLAMNLAGEGEPNLWDRFLGGFAEAAVITPLLSDALFGGYYRGPFRRLEPMSTAFPGARELALAALEAGYELTLATKPIFPESAIRERMRWAGIADLPFRLVTVAERMHACKPAPGYWREILAALDTEPADCLMAGNDRRQDLAAADAGIPTFLVDEGYVTGEATFRPTAGQGTLADLARLLGLD